MTTELGSRPIEIEKQVLRKKIKVLDRSIECLKEQGQEIPKEVIDLKTSLEEKLAKLA